MRRKHTTVSLVGPFLPNELAKLGQSSATVGVAFAAYPAFVMVGSPLAAVACAACGQAPVLYVGVVVEGGLAIVSGYFTKLASTGGGCMAVYCVLRALQVSVLPRDVSERASPTRVK